MTEQRHLEAIGDPDEAPGSDFASEHEDTAVDQDITAGQEEGESESPGGWDGMDQDGTP